MRVRSTAEALRRVLDSFALDLHVALPGVVRSYDASTQTAEIALGVQRVIPADDEEQDEDTAESLPILPSVPVIWPSAGGFFLHWPLAAGDTVQVLFNESDLNAWRDADGGEVDPGVSLRHALSGAVALPGLRTRANTIESADATHGRVGADGGSYIEFRPSEIRAGGIASLALAQEMLIELQAIGLALTNAVAPSGGGAVTYGANAYTAPTSANDIGTSVLKGS